MIVLCGNLTIQHIYKNCYFFYEKSNDFTYLGLAVAPATWYNSDIGDYCAYNNIKIKKFWILYTTQSYTNANGESTSKIIRKLGTLAKLSAQLHTDRDGVVEWANEQARLETLKYKSEKEDATVMIPFHSNRLMDYNKQKLFLADIFFFSLFTMNLSSILSA